MILNAYAILDLFVSSVRLILGLAVTILGYRTWRRSRPAADASARTWVENRTYLLSLMAVTLLVLDGLAWPLFYLLLNSYVPNWPGVMCIYGVTQVGRESIGASHYLPGLVMAIEYGRPAIVFLSGVWMLLYLVNRQATTMALTRRMLLALTVMGGLALLDAAAEAAYLAIPKIERHLAAGCCSTANVRHSSGAAVADSKPRARNMIITATLVLGATIVVVGGACQRAPAARSPLQLLLLASAGVASLVVGGWLLRDVAAPRLLGLPQHPCIYCLFGRAPDSIVMALFLVWGGFTTGWAAVAGYVPPPDNRPHLLRCHATLLRWSFWSYLGFAVMLTWELWLAR